MDWKKFDVEDKSTYPKEGNYFIWINGYPMIATFHTKEQFGSHWWEGDDIDDLPDDEVTHYCEIVGPQE